MFSISLLTPPLPLPFPFTPADSYTQYISFAIIIALSSVVRDCNYCPSILKPRASTPIYSVSSAAVPRAHQSGPCGRSTTNYHHYPTTTTTTTTTATTTRCQRAFVLAALSALPDSSLLTNHAQSSAARVDLRVVEKYPHTTTRYYTLLRRVTTTCCSVLSKLILRPYPVLQNSRHRSSPLTAYNRVRHFSPPQQSRPRSTSPPLPTPRSTVGHSKGGWNNTLSSPEATNPPTELCDDGSRLNRRSRVTQLPTVADKVIATTSTPQTLSSDVVFGRELRQQR